MRRQQQWVIWLIASLPAVSAAQSPFDGTWRPDPQGADPNAKPDDYSVTGGMYKCRSCTPSYKVKTDGTDQPVMGNPGYDTLSVKIIDNRTLLKIAKQKAQEVAESHVVVSPDGQSLVEQQKVFEMSPMPIELTSKSTRADGSSPTSGSLISGTWRHIETDLTHHDEDTTLRLSAGTVFMNDKMGRSFKAKLDNSDAPCPGGL